MTITAPDNISTRENLAAELAVAQDRVRQLEAALAESEADWQRLEA